MDNQNDIHLIYDLESLPHNLTFEQMFWTMKNSGIVIYDSTKGSAPQIIKKDLTLKDVAFLEKKEFLEKYEELMKEPPNEFSYLDNNQY